MTRERRWQRRALPWIALALMTTALAILWRGGRAPGDSVLAPDAAVAQERAAVADEKLPLRPSGPRREEPAAAPAVRSRSGPASSAPTQPARRITGRTVDELGRALEGVHVELKWTLAAPRAGEASVHHDTVSDAMGRFSVESFDGALAALSVSAWSDEHDLLEASPFERDASGEWLPVELVLTAKAQLGVQVLGAGGAPIEDLDVLVRVAPVEGSNLRAGEAVLLPRRAVNDRTDADGRVELLVSARRLLEVQLRSDDRIVAGDPEHDRDLSHDPLGEPLVLAPGERRELVVRLGRALVIEGTVARADGTPVADGRIRLLDGDPALIGSFDGHMGLALDDTGRFRFELQDLAEDARLAVLAVDGWWFGHGSMELHGAVFREVRFEEAIDGVVTLALVVDPLLDLQGRVLDADGVPLSVGTVWAIPRGAEYLLHKGPHGLLPLMMLSAESPGEFTLAGLLPGEYDLVVKRGEPRTYHRFDGYRAGQRGIELRIAEDREVAIRLSFEGAGGELRIQPVLLTHHFRRPSEHPRNAAPALVRVQGCELARWPDHEGSWSVESLEGRTISLVDVPRVASEHRFEPQQAGWYSVGARAWDATGRPCSRRLSEIVYLERGEHEFVIELAPTARLAGVAAPGECVEVLDAAGARVPAAPSVPFAQADGRGAFCFEEVPIGPLRVRVGTRSELERGIARAELPALTQVGEELALHFE